MKDLYTKLLVAAILHTILILPARAQIQYDPDFVGMSCSDNIACGYDSKGHLKSGEYGWYGEYCGTYFEVEARFDAYSDQLLQIKERLRDKILSRETKIALRKESKIIRAWKSADDRICRRGIYHNNCSDRMTIESYFHTGYSSGLDCEPPNGNSVLPVYNGTSPEVWWTNLPEKAHRLALLVVQKETKQIHWFILLEKESPYWQSGLPAGIPIAVDSVAVDGLVQFENDFGIHGYTAGPCLSTDLRFELYALRQMKDNDFGQDVVSIREALRRRSIKRTIKSGKYALYTCE